MSSELITQYLYPFLISFTIFILLLFKWWLPPSAAKKHYRPPPSPPKLPILGNLHQLGWHPHSSLANLSRKHGPLMVLRLGRVPALVVSSVDAARAILKTHDVVFSDRPKSSIFRKLLYDQKDVAMAPYGEYWRQTKSVFVLHLLSNKRVQSFRTVREEEVANLIGDIKGSLSSVSPANVNLSETFAALTNNVVCRVALGRKYGGKRFKEMLMEFVELLGVFNFGDYIPWLAWVDRLSGLDVKMDKVAKEFDDFLDEVVEEHVEKRKRCDGGAEIVEDKADFVDILLSIQKESTIGISIDRVCMKALILDAFAAGTDTTYTVLEWGMTELLRHPNAMRRAQDELRRVAGDKSSITEDDLDQMCYLKAVIKETLRLHPPIPLLIPRESTQDTKVNGYDVAAGTRVIVNAWAIARDPSLWDSPEEFHPKRFLNLSIDFKGHDFELIPFGAGRRGCPGIAFAIAVDELVLANLLHKFDWGLPDGVEELDMTESTGLTIHKKFPLIASAAIATP
ncbi:cytochrome P450 736A117-like [Rhodamnia argentea]|uniref:Cytochrome P450 736A117-like n=1 Tax=Rhodamnia argentea TaxID=178133 RepID=A0A8B8P923_9MYRT|nr:cytochrome P450 736A117-like [Rhodamnia argentea]